MPLGVTLRVFGGMRWAMLLAAATIRGSTWSTVRPVAARAADASSVTQAPLAGSQDSIVKVIEVPVKAVISISTRIPGLPGLTTAADEAWLVADNARREAENRRYDAMAAESAALDRHEAGLCC